MASISAKASLPEAADIPMWSKRPRGQSDGPAGRCNDGAFCWRRRQAESVDNRSARASPPMIPSKECIRAYTSVSGASVDHYNAWAERCAVGTAGNVAYRDNIGG